MAEIYIGIDPGLTGALAGVHWSGEIAALWDLPTMANGKGKAKVKLQLNGAGLAGILEEIIAEYSQATVLLERVSAMPGQGVASMFSMGDTFGCIRGVCAAQGLPVEIITPQQWKRYYKLTSDKEVCRAKAVELYPVPELSRKKDHNRAEALLIARYGALREARSNDTAHR